MGNFAGILPCLSQRQILTFIWHFANILPHQNGFPEKAGRVRDIHVTPEAARRWGSLGVAAAHQRK